MHEGGNAAELLQYYVEFSVFKCFTFAENTAKYDLPISTVIYTSLTVEQLRRMTVPRTVNGR